MVTSELFKAADRTDMDDMLADGRRSRGKATPAPEPKVSKVPKKKKKKKAEKSKKKGGKKTKKRSTSSSSSSVSVSSLSSAGSSGSRSKAGRAHSKRGQGLRIYNLNTTFYNS